MSAMGIDCRAATGAPSDFQEPDGREPTQDTPAAQGRSYTVSFIAPIRIQSNANLREHWRTRHARNKRQKGVIQWHMLQFAHRGRPAPPVVVTLTRIAPRRLDDDNMVGGFKAVRDQVAAWLGIDDGDVERVTWRYGQERGRPREYACHVRIEGVAGDVGDGL